MTPPTQTPTLPTHTHTAPLAPSPFAPSEPQVEIAPVNFHPQHYACQHCDATLDNQQRYCLNCGSRSGWTTNPAVDYIAGRQRKRGVQETTTEDRGIGGTGVTKQALPWLVGATLVALIVGAFFGSLRGDNNDALLAALANRPAAYAPVAATAPTGTTEIASDWTLDQGWTVQVATVPTGSDQAAVDAAKQKATAAGAKDVGVINPSDFTIDPDPAGAYVVYSGQFEKKADAEKALKAIKGVDGAKVVKVTSSTAGVDTEVPEGETSAEELVTKGVPKEKAAKDKKKIKEINEKKGDDFVNSQDEIPDIIINEPVAGE